MDRGCLTDLRFCCAANVVTASEAREPDVYRDCSNRLLDCAARWCRAGGTVTEAPPREDLGDGR